MSTSDKIELSCPRRLLPGSGDTWLADGSCSYCGSMNPDTFMERIEAGTVILGPTDKSYKVYVENNGGDEVQVRKFYFSHLNDSQMDRFVELLNQKKMNIGYPGYFYRLPFFIGPKN